jgi:hypothetical protein
MILCGAQINLQGVFLTEPSLQEQEWRFDGEKLKIIWV